MEKNSGPVRVMVVDDSAVVRGFLTRFLEEGGDIKVTASAPNGKAALEQLDAANPDVVILDLEMPVMDGLATLPLLIKARPGLPVIVASTTTRDNAALALSCLDLGAIDCLGKPTSKQLADDTVFRNSLVQRVRLLGEARRNKTEASPVFLHPQKQPKVVPFAEVLALCSSTGGPQALMKLFADLGALPVPVFVTQHMPASFTTILAENIKGSTGLDAREAEEGEEVKAGRIYIAPGDYHLNVRQEEEGKFISLTKEAPENFCRPSADPMLRSLAAAYPAGVLAVVLTGMGIDALQGCRAVVEAGGVVIAQDEASSTVWGMPRAVVEAGLAAEIAPLERMAAALRRRVKGATP